MNRKAILFPATLFLAWTATLAQGDFKKGLSYYKQGEYQKAIAEFEPIVQEHPDYEDGRRILAHCYLQTRQWDKAIHSFQKALELKDDKLASYLGLANAYYNKGRHDDAVATLLKGERYADSARDRLQIFRLRGSAYFNSGDYAKAVQELEKAQDIRRGGASDILQLGLAHYQLKNYEKAEAYLEQAKGLDPGNEQASRFLAEIQYQKALQALSKGQPAQAAPLLEDYLGAHPEEGEAWYNLGEAYLASDQLREAERAFRNAAERLSGKWEIQERLGYIYEVTERYRQSLEAYQKAYQASQRPDLKEAVDRLKERIKRAESGG